LNFKDLNKLIDGLIVKTIKNFVSNIKTNAGKKIFKKKKQEKLRRKS
jgi:hypothetical protein